MIQKKKKKKDLAEEMLSHSLTLEVIVQCGKEQKFTQIKAGQIQGMENHRLLLNIKPPLSLSKSQKEVEGIIMHACPVLVLPSCCLYLLLNTGHLVSDPV